MFGEVVRGHRRRIGLTQEELAERTGISVRGIRNLEAGRIRVPRVGTLRELADAFELKGAEREGFFFSARPDATAVRGAVHQGATSTWRRCCGSGPAPTGPVAGERTPRPASRG